MIDSSDLGRIAQNARILLNIHQGESRYFEWHRLVLTGIGSGCVVVTEPCVETGFLSPGVHYLEADATKLGEYCDWLLLSEDGQAKLMEIHERCINLVGNGFHILDNTA